MLIAFLELTLPVVCDHTSEDLALVNEPSGGMGAGRDEARRRCTGRNAAPAVAAWGIARRP